MLEKHFRMEGDESKLERHRSHEWARQAIEPFDQKPLEVKALLNVKAVCLF